jgi:hypothetical protein
MHMPGSAAAVEEELEERAKADALRFEKALMRRIIEI